MSRRDASITAGPAGRAEALLERGDMQWLLRPLSLLYGLGRFAHHGVYEIGLARRGRLPRPTICVGGLSVGGVGKTPFIIGLAAELAARGLKPAILSRGYGAIPPAREPRVVSDGAGARISVEESGDEPALIADALPSIPVVIGSSRLAAGALAFDRFYPDLFLLDDGFQHEPLARDVDLVLWDARDLPSRMRLLPAGRLREGLGGLRRARAIILTHAEYLPVESRAATATRVLRELKSAAPTVPVFDFETAPTAARNLEDDSHRPLDSLSGARALLVSGLARPQGFEATARALGVEILEHIHLGDHARHDAETTRLIAERARELGASITFTTAKDAVKLRAIGAPPETCAIDVAMRPAEPERWRAFLDLILSRIPSPGPAPETANEEG